VISAIEAVARQKLPSRFTRSPRAPKTCHPGRRTSSGMSFDSMAGKTVEINNTDARAVSRSRTDHLRARASSPTSSFDFRDPDRRLRVALRPAHRRVMSNDDAVASTWLAAPRTLARRCGNFRFRPASWIS